MQILKFELNQWLNLVRGKENKGLTVISATPLHEFGKENLSSKLFFLYLSCFLIFLLVTFKAPLVKELIKTSSVYNFALLDINVFAW